eukprot:Phypoly_transcript_10193.p1 GENE.Phypoly_transcript_10193~~Phypoly_transcript_10193.p1  ORF type:complete len:368 (+),score=28.55 Phypoly_transcript_10193:15-1118(+)
MEPDVEPINLAEYLSTQFLDLQQIFDAINTGPVLHLNLTRKYGNSPLNDDQLSYVLHELLKYKSLETLNLNGNDVRKRSCHTIVDLISQNNISRLELRLNYAGDFFVPMIAKALAKKKLIQYLSLAVNTIGPKGCKSLENLLRVSPLTHLDLMGNNLQPEGAMTLAQGLKLNKTLTHLDLKDTGIGPKGIESIAAAISHLPLTYLDLSYNRIADSGTKAISKALLNNSSLTLLKIGSVPTPLCHHPPSVPSVGSAISGEGLLALAEFLNKTPSLTHLSLDWQKRTKPEVLQTFFSALKNNTTITTFLCGSCNVPDNIIEDCFSVNRTITQGLGGKEMPLLNKFIRTNHVCKKLNASMYLFFLLYFFI